MVWKPLRPEPGSAEPRLIGDSLSGVTKRFGLAAPSVLTVVFAQWSDVVGQPLATHALPIGLRGTVLTIEVDEPAWATELHFLRDDLLARLNQATGPGIISEVVVQVRGAVRTRQMSGQKRMLAKSESSDPSLARPTTEAAATPTAFGEKRALIRPKSPEKRPKRP